MRIRRGSPVAALTIGLVAGLLLATTTMAQEEGVTLTLLHNGDGESSLLPLTNAVSEDTTLSVGGIAAFKSVTLRELADARALGHSVLDVYAGDAFLASATLACNAPDYPGISSLPADGIAQAQIPYDVHVFGNHEFDYGPDFLQRFIFGFVGETGVEQPFLSANLDFAAEPGWSGWIDEDGIVETPVTDSRIVGRSAIVTDAETGERFGVVGATSPQLPRDLVAARCRRHARPGHHGGRGPGRDRPSRRDGRRPHRPREPPAGHRRRHGARRAADRRRHRGGGRQRRAARERSGRAAPWRRPGAHRRHVSDGGADAAGRDVQVVTTAGDYRYLGRLDVTFGPDGEITKVLSETSGPRRVIPLEQDGDQIAALGIEDAVESDAEMITTVVAGVTACLDAR